MNKDIDLYNEVIRNAEIIWEYLYGFNQQKSSEAVVVCCSYDLRVCDYACDLFRKNNSKALIFSGNRGNWTDKLWSTTEAEVFKERAIQNGISPASIFKEENATNIGENISFSIGLLKDFKTVTFVSKPNTILRIKLTAPIHAKDKVMSVSSPYFKFPEEVSNIVGVYGVINEMVGDIDRIQKYPELGFQKKHDLPEYILEAFNFLIKSGFINHLIK